MRWYPPPEVINLFVRSLRKQTCAARRFGDDVARRQGSGERAFSKVNCLPQVLCWVSRKAEACPLWADRAAVPQDPVTACHRPALDVATADGVYPVRHDARKGCGIQTGCSAAPT